MTERRPHLTRRCPVPGCDWVQVISWFVGGPDVTERPSDAFLRMEAEAHLVNHFAPDRTIFT